MRHFSVSDEELHAGGLPVEGIVGRYGTPLFIYDGHVFDRKWDILRATFPPEFAIFYSVKANPNPTILKHFLAKGCGLEVASGGEFYLALAAGCPPEKVLFAGPGKTEAELELALVHGIGEIHVESLLEAERIGSISRRLGVRARVAVRVNPSEEAQGGALRMGGKSAPFGVDEESLHIVLDRLLLESSVDFRGIHLFTGTQILDSTLLMRQYRKGLDIARRVARRTRRPLQTVDFGGGLGIPYFVHEQELDMGRLRGDLAGMMNDVKGEALFKGTQFVIEPGRYLVGEAGIYITRIQDIKVSRGKQFLIVDGGMNHHLAASGNLGQVIKRNFPVALMNKLGEDPAETVDIVGPLCTPLDVLAREVRLPAAEVGDLVGISQSGAYARTASPLGFLSHPTPAEILAYKGGVRLIRRRGTYDDWLRDIPSEEITLVAEPDSGGVAEQPRISYRGSRA
jgi:diaminopimelate decarboxylase